MIEFSSLLIHRQEFYMCDEERFVLQTAQAFDSEKKEVENSRSVQI